MAGAYSGPHERRLLHDLMDQYNKVVDNFKRFVHKFVGKFDKILHGSPEKGC